MGHLEVRDTWKYPSFYYLLFCFWYDGSCESEAIANTGCTVNLSLINLLILDSIYFRDGADFTRNNLCGVFSDDNQNPLISTFTYQISDLVHCLHKTKKSSRAIYYNYSQQQLEQLRLNRKKLVKDGIAIICPNFCWFLDYL